MGALVAGTGFANEGLRAKEKIIKRQKRFNNKDVYCCQLKRNRMQKTKGEKKKI